MKVYYPRNKQGEIIGFKTREELVYDKDGVTLTDKLKNIEDTAGLKIDSSLSTVSDNAVKNKVITEALNAKVSVNDFNDSKFIDIAESSIPVSSWVNDSESTYSELGYIYKADINVSGVTTNSIVEIELTPANGNDIIAGFAVPGSGTVRLYAMAKPKATVNINRISIRKQTN